MKVIQSLDDIAYAAGREVPATSTVLLAYNGTEVEIDVSEESRTEVEKLVMPLIRIGRKPDASTAQRSRRGYNYRPGSRSYKQAMRDWADEQMALHPELVKRYNYITPGSAGKKRKQYYHPTALQNDYAAYLETGDATR